MKKKQPRNLTRYLANSKKLTGYKDFISSIKNAGYSVSINIIGLLLNFFVTFTLVKLLPPSEYGIYIYIYTWLGILIIISSMGFDSLIIRYLPKYIVEKKKNYFTAS